MALDNKQLQLRLDRARWWLLQNQPFYAQFVLRLVDVIGKRSDITTAATDGKRIFWDADYLDKLSDECVRGVALHEGLHCGLLHLWRLPANDRGNRAGDYEINLIVKAIPGCDLPAGVLLDEAYRDVPCERIYASLPEEDPKGGNGPARPGDFLKPADDDDAQQGNGKGKPKTPLRDEWESTVIQAAQAFGRGATPSAAASVLAKVKAPRVDWKSETYDFLQNVVSQRNDWSRMNRRMATSPVIYPRKYRDTVGTIVFFADASGSVGTDLCSEFVALIGAATATLGCKAFAAAVDTSLLEPSYWLQPGEECPLLPYSGGGTSFVEAFDKVRELQDTGEVIAGVVYLTDMDGEFPEIVPSVPTLWLAAPNYYGDSSSVAPFGRTVAIQRGGVE